MFHLKGIKHKCFAKVNRQKFNCSHFQTFFFLSCSCAIKQHAILTIRKQEQSIPYGEILFLLINSLKLAIEFYVYVSGLQMLNANTWDRVLI